MFFNTEEAKETILDFSQGLLVNIENLKNLKYHTS